MNTKNKKIKSIVTINAYDKKYYILKDQKFNPLKNLSHNTANLVASYVNNHDLISTSIEISRSIPNEDIIDLVEIKAYEELGLDQAEEYIIQSRERENTRVGEGEGDSDIRTFDIFVVEPEYLRETFDGIVSETKYIDLLIPSPLLYRSVYSKEILKNNGTHCFVYFGNNDTFITFYQNGEYLYAKSIEYSLEQIYDKYCELTGDTVNKEEFFNILETEGLKTIHADYQQNLMKLFGEIFIAINDIIIYAKRAFDLSTVDQMFIGSSKGPIIGLDEYSENYLGLQSAELNFDFNLNSEEWYTDQFQYMLAVAAIEYIDNDEEPLNLTIFDRAPAFHKRASGQFIISTLLAITLGISYPLYFLVHSYMNDATNLVLSGNNKNLKIESSKYKKIIGTKKKEIKKLDGIISDKSKIYRNKDKTLNSIYDKKVNYHLKSELLYNFANDIKQFDVNVNKVTSKDDSFTFSLLSKDDKEITKLIKHISERHFDRINSIDIEMISKDLGSEYYNGVLKVDLR